MPQTFPASFSANNAFFYYNDLSRALYFYEHVLGCSIVADYGFAKTIQLAATSFLTLVDGTHPGLQHSTHEPKTVTLALVTAQVERWYEYLLQQSVTITHHLNYKPGQAHDGFVALDPEGYFLEFERFNPHPENVELMPRLASLAPLYPSNSQTTRPSDLGVTATVLWLYYRDMPAIEVFFQEVLGLARIVDQGFAKVYVTSPSGFLGPVIAGQGLHPYSEQKAVTVSFLTDHLTHWVERLRQHPTFRVRTQTIEKSERFHAFVGYDPEGYFLEFNTFLEHPANQSLLDALRRK